MVGFDDENLTARERQRTHGLVTLDSRGDAVELRPFQPRGYLGDKLG